MEPIKDIKKRVYWVYFGLVLVGVAVVFQLFKIQLVEGEHWRTKAYHLSTEMRPVEANRGNILAEDGSMLATSVPVYDIRMDMRAPGLTNESFKAEVDSLALGLARLFADKPASTYKQELVNARKRGARYFLVKRKIDFNQMKAAKELPIFRKGRYKGGVVFEKRNIRKMPFGYLAQRTIGYTRDGVHPVGLEGAFDNFLAGTKGVRLEKRLAGGVWMPINDENEIEPEDGLDLHTTIDVNIQDVASKALLNQLATHNAEHGCVVLMEVKTGNIKAIANLTRTPDGTYAEKYNYAIGEVTEPGSTFKLASLIAAIDDGFVNISDEVDTQNGEVSYFGVKMHDTKEGGYGKISVKQAFEVSSNVGISKVISKNYSKNPQQFVNKLYQMRLHQPLGLQIAGEGVPRIKSPNDTSFRWSGITLTQMSIGYELLITPLQILSLYNAVANGGKMIRPRFVSELTKNGKVVKQLPVTVLQPSICSERTLKQVREMLEGVVEHGTATNLKSAHYKIAGKTGTARIANTNLGYGTDGKTSYQASFVGYFPADNPLYSCIVVVNSPSNTVYYGNVVAGPIFREIADKVYANRIDTHREINIANAQVAQQAPVSINGSADDILKVVKKLKIPAKITTDDAEWVQTKAAGKAVVITKAHMPAAGSKVVPNVVGMGLQDALFLLENAGLKVEVQGRGVIRTQSIPAGSRVADDQQIIIALS
ncbi:MAG TPA: penicillin-binding protein [Luteibaculaceae bacterium]|nr:penicillin-binding protein [Luteibaculaceae bacterium]